MEYPEAVEKLENIARDCYCDLLREVGAINGCTVFWLFKSAFRPKSKHGLPRLYSYIKDGVFELSFDEILSIIEEDSFNHGGTLVRKIVL